jgi:hypothetical protein
MRCKPFFRWVTNRSNAKSCGWAMRSPLLQSCRRSPNRDAATASSAKRSFLLLSSFARPAGPCHLERLALRSLCVHSGDELRKNYDNLLCSGCLCVRTAEMKHRLEGYYYGDDRPMEAKIMFVFASAMGCHFGFSIDNWLKLFHHGKDDRRTASADDRTAAAVR